MRQFSYPNSQFTNILGGASIGWKLNVYDTGTTDYASIYSNLAQTTPTANPVIADADGFLASFYWTGTVDVVLTDENDNIIDSASGIQDLVSTINAVVVAGNISLPYGAASGDGNTITATLPVTSDFSDGGAFIIRANANNAGTINTPNLQINSYASRRIKKIGGIALVANDIASGMNCLLVYNLAQNCYYLLNPNASYAGYAGNSGQEFAVAAGTGANNAVNKSQLDTKAGLAGNSEQEFAVHAATGGNNAVNKTQADSLISAAVAVPMAAIIPSGGVIMWPTSVVPTGFLELNGQSTTGYSNLIAIYGATLPDMRGEFVRGWDHSRGVDAGRTILSGQVATSVGTQDAGYGAVQIKNSDGDDGTYTVSSDTGSIGDYGGTWKTVKPRNVAWMFIVKT